MGFIATPLYAALGENVTAFKALVLFYVLCTTIPGIVFAFTFKEKDMPQMASSSKKHKLTMQSLKEIFKMPLVWVLVFFVYFSFIPKSAMTYFQGYMEMNFGATAAMISIIAIIRVQVIRLIINPVAGAITDKIRSASKMMGIAVFLGIIAGVITLAVPHDPALLGLIVTALFIFSIMYNITLSQTYIPLSEAKIPMEYTGTITGIVAVLGYSSDIYYYIIAGKILDKANAAGNPSQGYNTIFTISLVCSIIAFLLSFVLIKVTKSTRAKNEALEAKN